MAFNFENLVKNILDSTSQGVSTAVEAVKNPEKSAELRREHERTAIPEITSYYMNADQEPIDIANKRDSGLGEASSSVAIPNDVEAMEDDLSRSGYEPDKYLNGEGASLLKPKFEEDGSQGFKSFGGGNIDETAETANRNWLDNLIDNEGALNPNNWFILGTTEKEKQRRKDQKAYKAENATQDWMDTDANVPITNDEWQQKYLDYWNSKGGLEEGYRTGDKDVLDGLNKLFGVYSPQDMGFESSERPSGNGISDIVSGLDKISNENYDDGTLRWDSVKGKYMKGSEYKELVKAGFGGRPIEEIDDDATYNKLDEAASYGFIPFIQDQDQWNYWDATQVADNVSKAYNLFGDTRDRWTNEYIDYNGQRIDRDQFLDEADKTAQKWLNENGDQGKFVIPMEDGNDEVIVSNENPIVDYGYVLRDSIGDSSIEDDNVVVWFPNLGRYFIYPDDQDYQDNHPYADTRIPGIEYQQWDGSTISLDADEFDDLLTQLSTGSAQVDYSTGNPIIDTIFPNIGKNSTDRKDFSGMLGSLDFSDLAPNMADLFFGSAPLFFKSTAWPMAIANGISASEGLDARNYDSRHGTYQRLAEDMNAEKYVPNILLSSTVPATERIAGIIGGTGGLIGTPIQKALAEAGAPALLRYSLGVGGEGLEEIIASAWEDFQTNGWSNWFANPIYETDDKGNIIQSYNAVTGKMEPKIKSDTTGHQMRDPNTPWWERVGNFGDQALENGLGGSALGLSLGIPTVAHDKMTNSGYFADDLQKGKFGYRVGNPGENLVRITREDYGTYGKGKR